MKKVLKGVLYLGAGLATGSIGAFFGAKYSEKVLNFCDSSEKKASGLWKKITSTSEEAETPAEPENNNFEEVKA